MPAHRIEFTRRYAETRREVFALFASHERFGAALAGPLGAALKAVRRVKTAPDARSPDGEGSVRRILAGPLAVEETIVAYERDTRLEYAITKGGYPIQNHRGCITFKDIEGGTEVHYTIELDAAIAAAGPILETGLRMLIRSGLRRIGQELGNLN